MPCLLKYSDVLNFQTVSSCLVTLIHFNIFISTKARIMPNRIDASQLIPQNLTELIRSIADFCDVVFQQNYVTC